MKTEQEKFWEGEFGDSYIERNKSNQLYSSNLALFSRILQSTNSVNSVLELGCNIGMNLRALNTLLVSSSISGVDINAKAISILHESFPEFTVKLQSILSDLDIGSADFTFTKGVLIHVNPEKLDLVYRNLYENSNRYICVIEYYSPSPVSIPYRGHNDRLYKRDFCKDIMTKYTDLSLIDYGFVYRGDVNFPQDDLSWFLMEKNK